jgi:hypothetical protein
MNNTDKLVEAITEWLGNVAVSALPKMNIPPTSNIGRMMSGIFGINPARYNVWNELGFLLNPTIQTFVEPKLRQYLTHIPDENIEAMAMSYADALLSQATDKGSVNVFGIELGKNAFEGLKTILETKFNRV